MSKLTEADIRMEIDADLKNKGWRLVGKKKNVFGEEYSSQTFADYILKPKNWVDPLIAIEAKRTGQNLENALEQAKNYARKRNSPIAYAINEYNPRKIIAIKDREKLIEFFSFANNQLRDDGLTEGHERFSEFCSILFLKILSEQEEKERKDKRRSENYVNSALNCGQHKKDKFCCFQSKYGEDIFQRLQINSPATLKRIIDKLTPLQLVSIDIDVKGEAFEYFLKEAIKGQKKDLGQYFTPRHIVNFLVRLADPKPHETVYDPFCGTGGILIKVFNYIAERIPKNDAKKWYNLKEKTV
ncbi:9216_t:CDS:2 [Ambispora leptoticha]|uniref:site-specific DNA-methyltransferase (adenine-specific) n=1 Tax=Ambispora leptoticha TaxID=144679 RepID=A0A9N9CHK7_9GLOM|nr:9216_t:CDS:2 [Ambispora leptoticha]